MIVFLPIIREGAIQGVILSHVRVFQTLARIHPSPALSGTCEARAAAKPVGAG